MNCRKVLSRLHACVDGELPPGLMREMEKHLAACPSCRSQVDRIRHMHDMLDSFSVPPLPQGFLAMVMAEARRKALPLPQQTPQFGLDWRMPLRWFAGLTVPMRLAASAAVLLACFLGMFMSRDLSLSGSLSTAAAETENLYGFEWFSPTPPASLGAAYINLALTAREERGAR